MKKLLMLILTLTLLASSMLVLASCDGGEETPEETEVTYTITVKDQYDQPVAGVMVKMGDKYLSTDANGKITVKKEKADYKVTVFEVPEEFEKNSSEFSFDSNNNVTVVLQNSIAPVAKVTYTIYVKDTAGNPVEGARVQVCIIDGNCVPGPFTDAAGKATIEVAEDDYKAKLMIAPEGYKSNDTYFDFNSAKEATIVIEAE